VEVEVLALRLALDCHKEISNPANGVSVIAVKKITDRVNALGLDSHCSNNDIDNNQNNNFMR
jgi:hypothetical protein